MLYCYNLIKLDWNKNILSSESCLENLTTQLLYTMLKKFFQRFYIFLFFFKDFFIIFQFLFEDFFLFVFIKMLHYFYLMHLKIITSKNYTNEKDNL